MPNQIVGKGNFHQEMESCSSCFEVLNLAPGQGASRLFGVVDVPGFYVIAVGSPKKCRRGSWLKKGLPKDNSWL